MQVLGFMAVSARHAAAADADVLQFGAEAGEDRRPLLAAGRQRGGFGAVAEQIPRLAGRRLFGAIRNPLLQPFMHQLH